MDIEKLLGQKLRLTAVRSIFRGSGEHLILCFEDVDAEAYTLSIRAERGGNIWQTFRKTRSKTKELLRAPRRKRKVS